MRSGQEQIKEAVWADGLNCAARMAARPTPPDAFKPSETRKHAPQTAPVVLLSADCALVASLAAMLDNDMPMIPVSSVCRASSLIALTRAAVLVLDIDRYGFEAQPLLSMLRMCDIDCAVVLVTSISGPPEWIGTAATDSLLFGCLTKPLDATAVRNHVHYLLAEKGLRPSRRTMTSRRLANALTFIAAHYCEKVTMERLSRAVGSSRSRLAHLFSSEMDTTIAGVLSRVRIEVAKYLLSSTDEKLEKIAALSGFCDSSHLSRVLLKSIGCRPTEYRRDVA